ncbi:uncharacterized protein V1518DRAFT_419303 [Limtongia smithiae]|uniref:uncharacterized protein n=1 Tax=Limtongia smithiae TaxID=1125753 RepID=UPI0034CE361E
MILSRCTRRALSTGTEFLCTAKRTCLAQRLALSGESCGMRRRHTKSSCPLLSSVYFLQHRDFHACMPARATRKPTPESEDVEILDEATFSKRVPATLCPLPFFYPGTPEPPHTRFYRLIGYVFSISPSGPKMEKMMYMRLSVGVSDPREGLFRYFISRIQDYFSGIVFSVYSLTAVTAIDRGFFAKQEPLMPLTILQTSITGQDIVSPDADSFLATLPPFLDATKAEGWMSNRKDVARFTSMRNVANTFLSVIGSERESDPRLRNIEPMRTYLAYEFLRGAALAAREFVDRVVSEVEIVGDKSAFKVRHRLVEDGVVTERLAGVLDNLVGQWEERWEDDIADRNEWETYIDWALEDDRTRVSLFDVHKRVVNDSGEAEAFRYGSGPLEPPVALSDSEEDKIVPMLYVRELRGVSQDCVVLPRLLVQKPFDGEVPAGVEFTVDIVIEAPVAVGVVNKVTGKKLLIGRDGMDKDGYKMLRTVVSLDSQTFKLTEEDMKLYVDQCREYDSAFMKLDPGTKMSMNWSYLVPWMKKSYFTPELLYQSADDIQWKVSFPLGGQRAREWRLASSGISLTSRGQQVSDINLLALVMSFNDAPHPLNEQE